MPHKPKLRSLISDAAGMTLVIGTGLIVVVAIAMALFGPHRTDLAGVDHFVGPGLDRVISGRA